MVDSLWPRWGPWRRDLGAQAWEPGSYLWAGSKCEVQSSGEPRGGVRFSGAGGSGSRKLQRHGHQAYHSRADTVLLGSQVTQPFLGPVQVSKVGLLGWACVGAGGAGLGRVTCALVAVTGGQEGGSWGPCCALSHPLLSVPLPIWPSSHSCPASPEP